MYKTTCMYIITSNYLFKPLWCIDVSISEWAISEYTSTDSTGVAIKWFWITSVWTDYHKTLSDIHCSHCHAGLSQIPYKTIYWRGINIGDWRFFRKFANINNYMDTPTKPLQKLEKKDMVAQIANIKSTNCFLQTNSPKITLANKYSTVHWVFCI